MFGIDDALIWGPLVGAAIGGLTKKKDPLTGALMGAAVGYGGAALPGLLGGAGAAAEGAASFAPSSLLEVSPASSAGAAVYDAVPTPVSMGAKFDAAMKGVQPYLQTAGDVGKAASAANSVKGLLAPQEAPPTPQPMPNKPLDLSSVIGSNNQAIADQLQQDQQRKQLMSQFAQYAMGAR